LEECFLTTTGLERALKSIKAVMKELKTEYESYYSHQEMKSILERLKSNPQVVSSDPSPNSHGGGGYIRYQILKDAT
jgi:uncharacterized alpha/beta hydrolase family protein